MNGMLGGSLSHDHITRTIAQPELDQKAFWQLVKPSVRAVERDEGCICVDDFLVEKPHSPPIWTSRPTITAQNGRSGTSRSNKKYPGSSNLGKTISASFVLPSIPSVNER